MTNTPGIHPCLYDLDHLPNPLEESHHMLIAQDPDTGQFKLLTKHYCVHHMNDGVMYAYTGWADAREEERGA